MKLQNETKARSATGEDQRLRQPTQSFVLSALTPSTKGTGMGKRMWALIAELDSLGKNTKGTQTRRCPIWLLFAANFAMGGNRCQQPNRAAIVWTLSTGFGMSNLQNCVDEMEKKAIRKGDFSKQDKQFLVDLYRAMAFGGKVLVVLRQSGRLMTHYLNQSGEPYRLHPRIFLKSPKVQRQLKKLRRRVQKNKCQQNQSHTSKRFDMTDRAHWDAHVGLYYGTLRVTSHLKKKGQCELKWHAKVPWEWPDYQKLNLRLDNFSNKKRFLIPTIRGLLTQNNRHHLFISDGLGAHLTHLNLAKSFLAYGQWTETIPLE